MNLWKWRVVLVRPKIAGNLGATARIMANMGLNQLALVAPEADPLDSKARQQATHGEEVLNQARIVHDFADAVADCHMVIGTSARIGGLFRRQSAGPPEEILPHVIESLGTGSAALVFGPEPSGLNNTEVVRCHYLIHIPSDPTFPSLNLAQAVAICLYELRRASLSQLPSGALAGVPFEEQERMFSYLRSALEKIHFLYGDKADTLNHALRDLIGRARPTAMEVNVLFGLARQIHWYADNHPC